MRAWWLAKEDYDSVITYLEQKQMRGLCRGFMVLFSSLLLLMPPIGQLTSVAGDTAFCIARMLCAAVGLFWTVRWSFRRLPGQTASIVFVIMADAAIYASAALGDVAISQMFTLSPLVFISIYVAYLHGSRHIVARSAVLAIIVVTVAVFVADHVGVGYAVVKGAMVLGFVSVLPIAVSVIAWAMRHDAAASVFDELTGVLNRRGFFAESSKRIAEVDRATVDREIVVMVVDVDHFKRVNDVHGHGAGDEVLVRTAERIRAAVGPDAVVARLGGEEFAVVEVLPRGDAPYVAQRVRTAISAAGAHATVTASIGVAAEPASLVGGSIAADDVLVELLERADRAMYSAKAAGRDAVVLGG